MIYLDVLKFTVQAGSDEMIHMKRTYNVVLWEYSCSVS